MNLMAGKTLEKINTSISFTHYRKSRTNIFSLSIDYHRTPIPLNLFSKSIWKYYVKYLHILPAFRDRCVGTICIRISLFDYRAALELRQIATPGSNAKKSINCIEFFKWDIICTKSRKTILSLLMELTSFCINLKSTFITLVYFLIEHFCRNTLSLRIIVILLSKYFTLSKPSPLLANQPRAPNASLTYP